MDYSFNRRYGMLKKKRYLKQSAVLNRCPDSFIESFSSIETPNMAQWVSCGFSHDIGSEYIFALGDEEGFVTISDARNASNYDKFVQKSTTFEVDNGVVLSLCFVPNAPERLITVSGSPKVGLWDLVKEMSVSFVGHTRSVRTVSIWPDNPHCFITGGRDGSVIVWDIRQPMDYLDRDLNNTEYPPHRKYDGIHDDLPDSKKRRQGKKRLSSGFVKLPSTPTQQNRTITSIIFADENQFLSTSNSSLSGVRLWDMRYQQRTKPLRQFDIPVRGSTGCGTTSMCWDRFRSRFYVSCMDNLIYEYALWSKNDCPTNVFSGSRISSFYVQCVASPVSDHLLCGSSQGFAVTWDLQDCRHYIQDDCFPCLTDSLPGRYTLSVPRFKFSGHKNEVSTVAWSRGGEYITTLDDKFLRVWSLSSDLALKEGDNQEETTQIVNGVPVKIRYPEPIDQDENQPIPIHMPLST